MNVRRIGLAQPPRPFALAGWSSWSLHRGSDTVERALSSHALFVRVRNMSAAILSPDLPRSSLRSTLALTSPERVSSWSTPSSGSPERLPRKRVVALVSVSSPGWLCSLRLRGIASARRLWVPTTPSNPQFPRVRLVRPCGLTPSGQVYLSWLCACRESVSLVSC